MVKTSNTPSSGATLHISSLSDWNVDVSGEVYQDLLATTPNVVRLLEIMKISPSITTCRLNRLEDREATVTNLRASIRPWLQERSIAEDRLQIKTDYGGLPDLLALSIQSEEGSTVNDDLFQCTKPPDDPSQGAWPEKYKVIIVDRLTGEAVLRGSNVYVRGVQCASSTVRRGDPVALYSSMTSILRGLQLAEYTQGTCIFCGIGVAMADRGTMFTAEYGEAVRMKRTCGPLLPPMNNLGGNGTDYILQNLPSCVVAHALARTMEAGDTVLDMCAAPGGKTSQLASLMPQGCHIVACDKSARKVVAMKELFSRLQCDSVITCLMVNSMRVVDNSESRTVLEIIESAPRSEHGLCSAKAFAPESFRHILLDPPCSALGLRPKLAISQRRKGELDWNPRTQMKLVDTAVRLLQPGGYLTYSTCTVRSPENEGMVRYILDAYPAMSLAVIDIPCGSNGRRVSLSAEEAAKVKFFDPTESKNDTMGFFIAKFQKKR